MSSVHRASYRSLAFFSALKKNGSKYRRSLLASWVFFSTFRSIPVRSISLRDRLPSRLHIHCTLYRYLNMCECTCCVRPVFFWTICRSDEKRKTRWAAGTRARARASIIHVSAVLSRPASLPGSALSHPLRIPHARNEISWPLLYIPHYHYCCCCYCC